MEVLPQGTLQQWKWTRSQQLNLYAVLLRCRIKIMTRIPSQFFSPQSESKSRSPSQVHVIRRRLRVIGNGNHNSYSESGQNSRYNWNVTWTTNRIARNVTHHHRGNSFSIVAMSSAAAYVDHGWFCQKYVPVTEIRAGWISWCTDFSHYWR